MRLPVTPQLSTKDGVSAKNARLTNCLKETTKRGDMAVIRPGLVLSDTFTGVGSGLIPFDGRLLQIWNDTVYDQNDYGTWPLDAPEWDASTTYDWNDAVWYDGDLWFSTAGSNMGHAPGSGYWSRSPDDTDYDAGMAYDIGDTVTVDGVTYYSYLASNTGNTPSGSSLYWSTVAPGSTRYQGGLTVTPSSSGALAASVAAAGASAAAGRTYYDCSHKSAINQWTENPSTRSAAPYYIDATQYQGDCSFSVNQGTVSIGLVSIMP